MKQQTCAHLLDDLSDFLDGKASEEICAEIERHLSNCGNCRVMVDTLRKTILLYRELPQPELPPDARQRLYQSLNLETYLAERK